MKQVIVVRTDLGMGKGKIASQVAHASIESISVSKNEKVSKWKRDGMKKIVLKVSSEKELLTIYRKAKKEGLVAVIVRDLGKTQIKTGTITALAIGPDEDEKIDKITGNLKLL